MSPLVPARLVDVLPTRLWSLGNLYRVFGRCLHFCVGGEGPGGWRTIELDGVEIGRGRKPFVAFHEAPDEKDRYLAWRVDFGWIVAVTLVIAAAAVVARLLRPESRDIERR